MGEGDPMSVSYAPTEDLELIWTTARQFLEDRIGLETVRELMMSEEGLDRGLWKEIADLGWTGLAIGEEHGGAGYGLTELSVLGLCSSGAAIAIGSSASLAQHAGLPVSDHLVENGIPLTREQYFTPGSVLDMKIDHGSPLTHGFGERVNVLFSHSPTFSLDAGAEAQGVRRIGWYDTESPLKSGWAWGGRYLQNGVGVIEADYGQGKLFIFGPRITFRAQPHGTFGFLFNGIYYGAADNRPIS